MVFDASSSPTLVNRKHSPASSRMRSRFFDFATNFPKLEQFEGVGFRRWQKKMKFLLATLNMVYVLSTPKLEERENETREFSKDLWDTLEAKYIYEDASSKKFLVSEFNEYKMVDNHSIMEQFNEIVIILGQIRQHDMNMDDSIAIASIIDKLPPSWKKFMHFKATILLMQQLDAIDGGRAAVAGRNEETEKPSFGAAAAGRNRGTEEPLCRCSRRRNGGAPLSLQPPEKRKTPRLSSLKSELRAVGTPRLDGRSSREGRHRPPEVAVWTGGLGLSALRVSVWPAWRRLIFA
nr:uncharacterized protein LOC109188561 [Ipomoea trifida]